MGGSRGYKSIFSDRVARYGPDIYDVRLAGLSGLWLKNCTHVTPHYTLKSGWIASNHLPTKIIRFAWHNPLQSGPETSA
jgi:hypothetical protein